MSARESLRDRFEARRHKERVAFLVVKFLRRACGVLRHRRGVRRTRQRQRRGAGRKRALRKGPRPYGQHRLRSEGDGAFSLPQRRALRTAGARAGEHGSSSPGEEQHRAAVHRLLHRHRLSPAADPPGVPLPDRALRPGAGAREGRGRAHSRSGPGAAPRAAASERGGGGAAAGAGGDQRDPRGGIPRHGPSGHGAMRVPALRERRG